MPGGQRLIPVLKFLTTIYCSSQQVKISDATTEPYTLGAKHLRHVYHFRAVLLENVV